MLFVSVHKKANLEGEGVKKKKKTTKDLVMCTNAFYILV